MRFIHISDASLFAEPEKDTEFFRGREKEKEETFQRILDACNDKDIDLLLIAGNLFAAPPDTEKMAWLDEKLQKLVKTRTILITGNQDYLDPNSDAALYHFHSRTVLLPPGRTTNAYLRGINTCVTGYSYAVPACPERILEGIDPGRKGAINILIGCGGKKGNMPFSAGKIARKGFDYVALGGSTKPVHLLKNRIAYSGMPEPGLHTQEGRHGYILGEITDEGVSVRFVPAARRNCIVLEVTLRPDMTARSIRDEIEEKLRKLGNENIYTLVFRGFVSGKIIPDLKRIEERYHIYAVRDLTISRQDEESLRQENRDNLMGEFISSMREQYTLDEKIRTRALRYGMEALIMAGDKE